MHTNSEAELEIMDEGRGRSVLACLRASAEYAKRAVEDVVEEQSNVNLSHWSYKSKTVTGLDGFAGGSLHFYRARVTENGHPRGKVEIYLAGKGDLSYQSAHLLRFNRGGLPDGFASGQTMEKFVQATLTSLDNYQQEIRQEQEDYAQRKGRSATDLEHPERGLTADQWLEVLTD